MVGGFEFLVLGGDDGDNVQFLESNSRNKDSELKDTSRKHLFMSIMVVTA